MKSTNEFKVGQNISFGRPNGEKTLAKVIKVNRKSLKVEALQSRGRGRGKGAGRIWNVHPNLCAHAALGALDPLLPLKGPSTKANSHAALVTSALGKLTREEIGALSAHFARV